MDARIVVLGESLGHEEWEQRRPFVGRSGKKLRNWMRLAGIAPERCRIENVYPFYPPGGAIDNVDTSTLALWQNDAVKRLEACTNAQVIVCVGNAALETLTGFRDITRRRGSVYHWKGKKVIGVIHPAAVLRRGEFEKHGRLDFERVKLLAQPHTTHNDYCGCAIAPKRQHSTPFNTEPKQFNHNIKRYIDQAQNPKNVLAIDVETPKKDGKRQLLCTSFAFSATESLVIPWNRECGPIIKALCESPCIKLGHNFVSFDRWWLARAEINITSEIRDTMCIHHCLDPASSHSLEFLTSRYTWEPWYKDEGKGHDIALIEADQQGYFEYCGLDSCLTWEIHNLLWPELERRGLLAFYRRHYEDMYDLVLDLMLQGVYIDHDYRKEALSKLLTVARTARDQLGVVAGKPLFTLTTQRDRAVYSALISTTGDALSGLRARYGDESVDVSLKRIEEKTVSNAQLKTLLYDTLGLPLQTKRRASGEETATAESVALRKIRLAYPDRADVCEVIDQAMLHNKAQKLASFLYPNTFDEDGKFRFTVKLNTEAGRLASSKAPNGLGRNSQNTARDDPTGQLPSIRRVIVPDPGHILLEADASQIEGRIVFVRTKDENLIKLARARTDFDQHSYVASLVFKKPIDQVGKGTEERQTAKSVNHAAMRAMQGRTMADRLLKDGVLHADGTPFTAEECDKLLEAYYQAFGGVRLWQQRIRREVRLTKRLVNSWGRVWDVRYEELNDDLFRRAYNFLPQSECAELTNVGTFVPLARWIKKEGLRSRIRLQEHDALVCSCPIHEAYDVALFMKEHIEVEREYDGVALSVPVEFGVGPNYGEKRELRELPERSVFEAMIRPFVREL